jgi:hypothetical protein
LFELLFNFLFGDEGWKGGKVLVNFLEMRRELVIGTEVEVRMDE